MNVECIGCGNKDFREVELTLTEYQCTECGESFVLDEENRVIWL